ncbi:BRO family protein [Bifidobacterium pseudolongum]|uniref:BRO family protein n=1 Tax=Bifidobacterium pseudolongum TaxID=1694 RepID=UPI0010EB1541|nr:BRO family protein [Bifidobacterium pseudolongum]RYQ74595.1 phage anti-repressor protein [Bifidobacterium pseudolongum subsp. globosum]
MNSEIANYDFHGSAVRIHVDGDTVEYCARDIATALGYTNPNKAIGDHCKGVTNRYPLATAGGVQQAVFISEGDVYRLIVSSQLPAAVEFERWLFDEVVPQIRRTGGYIPVQAADDEKSILARAVLIAQNTISEKDKIIEAQRSHIEQTEPLARTALAFTAANGTMSIRAAARQFSQLDPSMTLTRVYRLLRADGYIEQHSCAPTVKATRPGYLKPKTGVRPDGKIASQYAHFTPKGMGWFVQRYIYGTAQGTLAGTGTEA